MRRGTRNFLPVIAGFLVVAAGVPLAAPPAAVAQGSPNLVISQVYGGGGNSGATYTHDFIELFNRGEASVNLDGLSLQYASATGTGNFGANSGQLTELPNATLPPGRYLLVEQAAGTGCDGSPCGDPLPSPDATDNTPINMAGSAGKVALVNGTNSLGCNGGSNSCSPEQLERIIDLVGYGGANFFEGTAAAPTLSNSTAALRDGDGCTDTDDNGADFSAGTPSPRNTATAANACGDPGDPGDPPSGADVVVSQVYGGGGNTGAPAAVYTHDFIELFNRSDAPASLGGWSVQYASASGTTWQVTSLGGTLQPGQYYLVQQAQGSGGSTSLPAPDAVGSIAMSATNGKVALVDTTSALSGSCPTAGVVDFVGFGGTASCFEGDGPTATLNNNTAALRLDAGCRDTDDNASDFTTASPPAPRNSASPLSPCAPDAVTDPSGTGTASPSTVEAGDSTLLTVAVTPGTNPTSTDIAVTGDLTDIGGSPSQPFFDDATNGDEEAGDLVFSFEATVDPATGAGAKSMPVTITDGQDRSGNTTINLTVTVREQCGDPFTPTYTIQGSGNTTPLAGQTVSTQGVVIGAYEGGPSPEMRGFYIQDPLGDGDPETSDGLFVFTFGSPAGVAVGDLVRVSGRAVEFQDQTQLDFISAVTVCDTDADMAIEPTDVELPFLAPEDGVPYLERYEGMLVGLPQTLYVTEHFHLGRGGHVTMSSGDRLFQPTNLVLPGEPAAAMQAANDLNRIIIDDDSQSQNPDPNPFGRGGEELTADNTLRGGDTATGIVGVMTYTWAGYSASGNAFRVRPLTAMGGGAPDFQPANPRPAAAPDVGGSLHVSNFNVLNYFNTFSGCTGGVGGAAMDCRGADNATEFERQSAKIVAAIVGLGADVVGLMEVENDGYGPQSAIAELVDRLNAATAPGTWAFIDADALTGELNSLGTDAIKNGFIYRPAAVTPAGTTAVLNSVEFVNGGDNAPRNRPALTQAFRENGTGETFIASVHHLKSKGSACNQPDQGDGQGNCNQVRLNAVNELLAWLATDPTGTGDPDILILGDLNSYAREDPIRALEDASYTNLVPHFLGEHAYSFVFDAQWGALDHALGSFSFLSQVTGVSEWHINSDEPTVLDYNTNFKTARHVDLLYAPDEFRSSDHDPVVIGLQLQRPAGRVTGGGTFADNSIETSIQYLPNSAAPSGNTTLSVAAGTLVSTSYDWLVVEDRRATYHGRGTFNGVAGHTFFLSIIDGGEPGANTDLIRVSIRDPNGALVYDNQPGAHITAQPATPLSGGNLRVH